MGLWDIESQDSKESSLLKETLEQKAMASSTKAMDPAFQGAGQRVYPFSSTSYSGRY